MGVRFDPMLVQQEHDSKPQNPKSSSLPTSLRPNRFSPSKSLDFSTWFSENLYKIVTIGLLISTVAALFFLPSSNLNLVDAFYGASSPVVQLTPSNLKSKVTESLSVYAILIESVNNYLDNLDFNYYLSL
ncbi:hypothetical protein LXL04_028871 [Taraxacum kok-saghyz]